MSPLSPYRHNDKVESASQPTEEVLRGCSLYSLLCNRSLLRSSESNVAAHTMSAPVDSLDIFLSHAWSDSGLWKQIALLLCCSPCIAYKATILLSILGAWFLWDHDWYYKSIRYETTVMSLGFVAFIVCTITFSLYKHRNTMVFLDNCCINQTDLTEKARGISMLSDYLQNSGKLIIFWTPNYLDRLWCVYELAVFMRTHDTKDVIVVNLGHVKLCVSLTIVQLLGIVLQWPLVIFPHALQSLCNICEVIVTFILVGREFYRCSEEWTSFASSLESFDVSQAECSSRDDYNRLQRLIQSMYGSEANFSALVKRIWLEEKNNKRSLIWFTSQTSWRIMTAPFVPAIAEGVIRVFLIVFTERLKPLTRIAPAGTTLEMPSTLATLAWAIRTRLLPALLRSFQVSLMLSLAHKLARQKPWLPRRLVSGVQYTFAFVVFTWLSRAACGISIFHILLPEVSVQEPCYEVLSVIIGFIALGGVWSISNSSYSFRLPSTIS